MNRRCEIGGQRDACSECSQHGQRSEYNFGAVILAAGFSSRMGAFKPLLPLGDAMGWQDGEGTAHSDATSGEAIIQRLIRVSQEAGVQQIAVVTGHNREQLQPYIEAANAIEAFNPHFEQGMFTSMQAGTAAMSEELDGFFMIPVDCPLITAEVLKDLMDSFEPDKFSVACYRGKKGHPLLIPVKFRREIIDHDGKNGLKAITDRDFRLMKRIETGYEGVVMDMDTPAAYEEIKAYLAGGCKSDDLQQLAKGRRFILIRHGQIQQHKEKIFLGQTDVPLSEKGRAQAAEAAIKVRALNPETDRIYTSDLLRAAETAESVRVRNLIPELIPEKGFREMNLGPWDGKFISEIKETMPEEFEKRGQNLMTYKMGHGSENFFDLQYRVCRTLAKILKEDSRRDLIITAHSGVLRAIINNLQGGSVADSWDKMNNGEVRVVEM